MNAYGQFCPVAKAMELLDERWTLLLMRELLVGSRHFSELKRGLPRMSPTLLSQRLRTLTRAGIIQRRQEGNRVVYEPTGAGEELRPIVYALAAWGVRWIPDLGDEDLDPHLMLWEMHRNVDMDAVPEGRTVIRFHFDDVPRDVDQWWLVISPDEIDICDDDPGFDVDVTVECRLRTLTRVWRGDRSWGDALRGDLRVDGGEHLRRALPGWFQLPVFAGVPRDRPTA